MQSHRLGYRRTRQNPPSLALLFLLKSKRTLIVDFNNAQGVIFVVDSSDKDRISEARDELDMLLNAEELRHAVLLVYANKQDLPDAMGAVDLTSRLGLHDIRNRDWYIQGTCGISGEGLIDGHPDSKKIADNTRPGMDSKGSEETAIRDIGLG